jgi:regulator of replication initiation timing
MKNPRLWAEINQESNIITNIPDQLKMFSQDAVGNRVAGIPTDAHGDVLYSDRDYADSNRNSVRRYAVVEAAKDIAVKVDPITEVTATFGRISIDPAAALRELEKTHEAAIRKLKAEHQAEIRSQGAKINELKSEVSELKKERQIAVCSLRDLRTENSRLKSQVQEIKSEENSLSRREQDLLLKRRERLDAAQWSSSEGFKEILRDYNSYKRCRYGARCTRRGAGGCSFRHICANFPLCDKVGCTLSHAGKHWTREDDDRESDIEALLARM